MLYVYTDSRRRRSCEGRSIGAAVVAIAILGGLDMEEISGRPNASSTGFVVSVLVATHKRIGIKDQHASGIANIISWLSVAIADSNQWFVSIMNKAVASGVLTSQILGPPKTKGGLPEVFLACRSKRIRLEISNDKRLMYEYTHRGK